MRIALTVVWGLVAAITFGLFTPGYSEAAVITTPAGVTPGQKYRLVFVTRGLTTRQPNISVYNTFVRQQANQEAALNALGTSWSAIISTNVDARDNTSTNPNASGSTAVALYRLDGTRIANSYADLWDGSIAAPILFDQFGVSQENVPIQRSPWAATTSSGTATLPGGITASRRVGEVGIADNRWINAGAAGNTPANRPIYAMSGVLTAVPIPAAFPLFVAAVAGLSIAAARKDKSIRG